MAAEELTRRCLRFGWRLTQEQGEWVLRGNGADAAFRTEESLTVWLEKIEKAERKAVAEPSQVVMDFAA